MFQILYLIIAVPILWLGSNRSTELEWMIEYAMSIFWWAFLYDMVTFTLIRYNPWMREMTSFDSPPPTRGLLTTCIIHQLGVCVVLLLSIVLGASEVGVNFGDWWKGDWGSGPFVVDYLSRHAHYCVIGYLVKDFWFVGGVDPIFLAHHIFAWLGCTICLLSPLGAGMISANALVAGIGSGFYNVYSLNNGQDERILLLYALMMTGSNVFVTFVVVWYTSLEELPTFFRDSFIVLAVCLVAIRQIGTVLVLKRSCDSQQADDTNYIEQGSTTGTMHVTAVQPTKAVLAAPV